MGLITSVIQPSGPLCWISSPVWERRACYGPSRRSPRRSAAKVTLSLTATAFRPATSRQLHVEGWPKSLTDRKHVRGHLASQPVMFQLHLLSQQQNAAAVRTCYCPSPPTAAAAAPAPAPAQLFSVEVCATFTLAQAQRAPTPTSS